MAVNVKGIWLCCSRHPHHEAAGQRQDYQHLVGHHLDGSPVVLALCGVERRGLRAYRALARELSDTGINVNTITPGYTRTEAAQGLADPETVAHIREWVLDQQIIKRNEEPSDLTGTLVFLASEDSDFITGQTINVNGGATHH
jgi:3-oxoacyl-[acyl-carrier protein] reductase